MNFTDAYSQLPPRHQQVIETVARSGNWIAKFGSPHPLPEKQVWSAIEGAYRAWYRNPRNVPHQVRDIFRNLEREISKSADISAKPQGEQIRRSI